MPQIVKVGSSGNIISNVEALVDELRGVLAKDKINVQIEARNVTSGFTRVYFGKGGKVSDTDLYLDLKIGSDSPGGSVIFADTAKGNTPYPVGYSVLNIAENARESKLTATKDTFANYIRAIYDRAAREKTSPQNLTYTVAHEGDARYGLPGLAALVTPSATESTMDYVSKLVAISGKFNDPYEKAAKVQEVLRVAASPAATPELKRIALYGQRKDYLQPLVRYGSEDEAGLPVGEVARYPLSKVFSKRRSMFDTGSVADIAFTEGESGIGKVKIEPTMPTTGRGYNVGWIRGSVVFPGEKEPRVGTAERQLFSDMPDISGALIMSSSAGYHATGRVKGAEFNNALINEWNKTGKGEEVSWGTERYRVEPNFDDPTKPFFRKLVPIKSIGERQYIRGELGISNKSEFDKVFGITGEAPGGVGFRNYENRTIAGSGGSFLFGTLGYKNTVTSDNTDIYPILMGRYRKGDSEVRLGKKLYYVDADDPDKPIFKEVVKALMERKGYDVTGGKTRIHLPMYYDPQSGNFANSPRQGFYRTDELKTRLEELFGDKVEVSQFASSGAGGDDSPAEMYAVMEAVTDIPIAHKGSGYKAFETPAFMNLKAVVEATSGTKEINIDYANAEFKEMEKIAIGTVSTFNLGSVKNFVELFTPSSNPKQLDARKALLEYIDRETPNLKVSAEEMANIWNAKTGEGITPERLFGIMLRNAANTSQKDPDSMLTEFGLAFPVAGQFKSGIYSKETAEALLKEAKAAGGEDLLSVEPLADTSDFVTVSYHVPGRDQGKLTGAIVMNAFNTLVPEYPSNKQGLNVAASMSMIQRYPEGARSLGLLNKTISASGQATEYLAGIGGEHTPASDRAMFGLTLWHSYQKELSNFKSVRPQKAVLLTDKLATKIFNAFTNVQKDAKSDKQAMDLLTKEFDEIDKYNQKLSEKDRMYPVSQRLASSMIYARNQYTLAPALEWIKAIEYYGGGIQEETSRTYYGKQYSNLLTAMVSASQSEEKVSLGMVSSARDIFFNRISRQLSGVDEIEVNAGEAGSGSKELKRLFTRSTVPGATTSRYQESKALPPLYTVVSDKTLYNMLKKSGTVSSRKDFKDFMEWFDKPGTYLPGYTQRFPDVSAEHQLIPTKIISQKKLNQLNPNLVVPKTMNADKGLYVSYAQNEIQVGDMDADINQTIVQKLVKTEDGDYELPDEQTKKEWQGRFGEYTNDPFNYYQKILGSMFGSKSKDLNIATKTMRDFVDAIKKGKYALQKRMQERRMVSAEELRVGLAMEAHSKQGMGAAYNARRFMYDIADTVLGTSKDPEIIKLRKEAYENQSLNYQIYLDRLVEGAGGFSVFEEMSRTANLSLSEGYDPTDPDYRANFRLTKQGLQDLDNPKDKLWTLPLFQRGTRNPELMLRTLADQAAQQPLDKMTNASLAWGFAARGHELDVYQALENADYADRRWVMADMADKGYVGLNSPAQLLMSFSMIERFAKKNPTMVSNENIKLPWVNGEIMPIRDIMKTKQYKMTSALNKVYIKRPDLLTPEEFELFNQMDPTRAATAALGIQIYAEELVGPRTKVTARDRKRDEKMLEQVFGNMVLGQKRVHASQLGNLIELAGGSYEGWSGLDPRFRGSEIFKVITANTLNLAGVIANRDAIHEGKTIFMSKAEIDNALKTGDIDFTTPTTEPIEAGKAYEAAFTQSLADSPFEYRANVGGKKVKVELTHVGQANPMEYELAQGLTIAGTPDYIGFDKATGSFTIVDTKYAAQDVGSSKSGPRVLKNVKSYKNRVQQLLYAYGFEKYAKRSDSFSMDSDFAKLVQGWGVSDEETISSMYGAAKAGKFKIFIQPGSAEDGLRRDVPIEIAYGDKERQELDLLGKIVKRDIFSPKMWAAVMGELSTAAKSAPEEPGYIPPSLRAGFGRTTEKFAPALVKALDIWSKMPFNRMAGGGKAGKGERIRVGEGGPEEIIVDGSGEVTVVPTHMMTENRLSQNQQEYASGQGMQKLAEGKKSRFRATRLLTDTSETESEGEESEQKRKTVTQTAPNVQQPSSNIDSEYIKRADAFYAKFSEWVDDQKKAASLTSNISRAVSQGRVPAAYEINADLAKAANNLIKMTDNASSFYQEIIKKTASTIPMLTKEDQARMKDASGAMLAPEQILRGFEDMPGLVQKILKPTLAKYAPLLNYATLEKTEKSAMEAGRIIDKSELMSQASKEVRPIAGGTRMQQGVYEANELAKRSVSGVPSQDLFAEAKLSRMETMSTLLGGIDISPEDKKEHPILQASDKVFSEYVNALREETDITKELSEAKKGSAKEYSLLSKHHQAMMSVEIAGQKAIVEQLGRELPPSVFDKTGRVLGTPELLEARRKGVIGGPEFEQAVQYNEEAGKLSQQQRALAEKKGLSGVEGISRHLLGGWGIFYMGTLAGLGETQYSKGFQQMTTLEDARYAASSRYLGTGMDIGNRTEQYFQSMSAMGGNIPWTVRRERQGQFAASGLSDIAGAGMTGVGAAALSLYVGDLLTSAAKDTGIGWMKGAGGFLGKAAPIVGGIVAGGNLLFDQWAYASRPVETGISVAGSMARQAKYRENNQWLLAAGEGVGQWYKELLASGETLGELSPTLQKLYKEPNRAGYVPVRTTTAVGQVGRVEGYYNKDIGRLVTAKQIQEWGLPEATNESSYIDITKTQASMLSSYDFSETGPSPTVANILNANKPVLGRIKASKAYTDLAKELLSDKTGATGKMLTQEEKTIALQTIYAQNDAYAKYNYGAFFDVAARQMAAGNLGNLTQEQITSEVSAVQAGYNVGGMATSIAKIIGKGTSTETIAKLSSQLTNIEGGLTDVEAGKLDNLVNFVSNSSKLLREAANVTPEKFSEYRAELEKKYGGVMGTPKEQTALQILEQQETLKGMGLFYGGIDVKPLASLARGEMPTAQQQEQIQINLGAANVLSSTARQLNTYMTARGMSSEQAAEITSQFGQSGYKGLAWQQGLISGNPMIWTQTSRFQNFNTAGKLTAINGREMSMNTLAIAGQDLSGSMDNRGMFQSSLWMGDQTPQMTADLIFGRGWENRDTYGFTAGAVNGAVIPGFEELGAVGGMRYLKLQQTALNNQQQLRSLGIQASQINLQRSFTTGVGLGQYAGIINPQTGTAFGFNTGPANFNVAGIGNFTSQGGGFWGYEDASRAMQRMQTDFNYSMQQRQMQLQTQQFNQNMAMNIRQNQVQRGWTMQDWSTNQNIREMQWGWRQEDFQENARFMTGRERRLAERQMRRETTMHDVEEDQINKQKNRQKELWRMEDERFRVQRKQFEENKKLQEESMTADRAFYEERIKLEDEQIAMQRAYWTQNTQLQLGAIGAQASYIRQMQDLEKRMLLLNEAVDTGKSNFQMLTELLQMDLSDTDLYRVLREIAEIFGITVGGKGGGGGNTGNDLMERKALGGWVNPGTPYIVGENEAEVFVPSRSGEIVPYHRFNSSSWNATVNSPTATTGNQQQHITLVINLGNNQLARYVINAVDQEISL